MTFSSLTLGKFCLAAGIHHFFFGSNQNMGRQLFEKALKLSRSCGDTVTQCSALTSLAAISLTTGDHSTVQINVHEGRRLAILTGNLYQEAHLLWIIAQCTCRLGDYRNSISHLRRAQEILDICGYVGGWLENLVKGYVGEVYRLKSEYTEARSIHTQNLDDTSQAPINRAWALVCIAQIDVMTGTDAGDVQRNLNEAKMILCHTKYVYGVTWCEIVLADLKLREGDILSAEHLFQDCLNSIWGTQPDLVSVCLERLADRGLWHAKEPTSTWPAVYLAFAQQLKDKLALHKAVLFFGDVFISQRDDNTAHNLSTVALEGFNCMDVHCSRAQCLLRLGDLARNTGEDSNAVDLWTTARPLFERSSQAKDIAQIDARLAALQHNQQVLVHLSALIPPKQLSRSPQSRLKRTALG